MTDEKPRKKVWVDGCYDLVHFGHANNFRQAREFGDYLVVGVHSDEEIAKHKRKTVLTEEERYKIVKAIKWVDEVVRDAPYVTSVELLDEYQCDFCIHGDDPTTTADGKDSYHLVKEAGRYKQVKRTAGISTTNLVNRVLETAKRDVKEGESSESQESAPRIVSKSPYTGSKFLATTKKIIQISNNTEPKEGDRIIYVDGAFDLFHVGHLDFLEAAKKEGDFLIVGLYSDEDICEDREEPIMNLMERAFNVLACRYVDDVVFGAPMKVTEELMDHFKVDLVCCGITSDEKGRYDVPKAKEKFKIIDSKNDMTTAEICKRIIRERSEHEARNVKKEERELEAMKYMNQDLQP
ncbi:hypothetical protein QAD02_019709 [Eretmocerus hayati]|uniref:Uncharacterized protein n=1 Tax=Eretmocerus hayati TaxID=131215 RepID=A0ACC2PKL8_9HYME|nr:hypothetical protein QAD02_019709 [Eretmocerus hayati]